MPRGCATAQKGRAAVRRVHVPRSGPAFRLPNFTPQAPWPSSPTVRSRPWPSLLGPVAKTGRCVIVHEAARTGGFGAEIAGLMAERGLTSVLAPVARVTGYDTVMPLPRLEQHYMPSVDRIAAAGRKACRFS